MSKSLLIISSLIPAFLISGCQWSSEQGPTRLKSIQKAQQRGTHETDEYEIIDITTENIAAYNKKQNPPKSALPRVDWSRTYSDAIRPYDKISIQVFGTSEAGGPAQASIFGPLEVPQSGVVSIPYAGEFNLLGKQLSEVQKEIGRAYSTVFSSARMSIVRVERLPLRANVIGIARAPGQQIIDRKGVSLADLVAKSGGTTLEPFTCEYLLHRSGSTYQLSNKDITNRNVLAQDGDILEIRKSAERSITLLGAVNRPGTYPFPSHDSKLDDVIGQGGGFREDSADIKGVFIFRKMPSQVTNIYRFNLSEPDGVIGASEFAVHGNDIVYVTEASLTRWNRTIRNILPFSQVNNFSRFGAY
ncbi:MAG: SLBB domain-containing protein [Akkermansiaceae bacterium]